MGARYDAYDKKMGQLAADAADLRRAISLVDQHTNVAPGKSASSFALIKELNRVQVRINRLKAKNGEI